MFHLIFYLKEFNRNIIKSPLSGLGFITLTFFLLASMMFRIQIQEKISAQIEIDKSGGHFHTLVASDQNHSRLARQLRSLPGVLRVEELSETKIQNEVKGLFGSLNLENMKGLFDNIDMSYSGLKVVLTQEVESRSIDLIKDYMSRLVGSDNLMSGPFVQSQKGKGQGLHKLAMLSLWGSWIFTSSLFIIWSVFTYFFAQQIRRHSYLIEQFQRRERVAPKMFLSGFLTVSLLFSTVFYLMGGQDLIALSAFFAAGGFFTLLLLKKFDWAAVG